MDDDLDLLRSYRLQDADPPRGLQERLEEDLLHAMLDETSPRRAPIAIRATQPARRRWFSGLARPAIAFATLAVVAGGIATISDGGGVVGGQGSNGSTSAVTRASTNVLDGAAASLFGGSASAAAATPRTPVIGTINASEPEDAALLAAGPRSGTVETLGRLTRDPDQLAELLRAAPGELGVEDTHDRIAFHIAMTWVADASVPTDLRAAMLRSLGGLDDIDPATAGVDILGRPGIALGHLDSRTGVREQYLLAQDGGTLLERRSFTTTYLIPGCPPSTYTYHALYQDGQRILPAELPYQDWPTVVPACDPNAAPLN